MILAGATHKCPNPLRNNDFEKLRERERDTHQENVLKLVY